MGHLPALRPPIRWRQQPPYPAPPAGYELKIYRAKSAWQASQIWGVRPMHISHCTYALWVPVGVAPPGDSPLMQAAREWLRFGGLAASHVAERDYPFGRARILAYGAEMGVPLPSDYTSRMSDVSDFLNAARRIIDEESAPASPNWLPGF